VLARPHPRSRASLVRSLRAAAGARPSAWKADTIVELSSTFRPNENVNKFTILRKLLNCLELEGARALQVIYREKPWFGLRDSQQWNRDRGVRENQHPPPPDRPMAQ
jgi:hypothetical protein